jgi:hypothetical protein
MSQWVRRCQIGGRVVFLAITALLAVIATHSAHAANSDQEVTISDISAAID